MENEPQIEERYRRVYRTFETADGKKSFDLFVRQDKDKTTISTIQSEKIAEGEEQTLSVFMREEKGKVFLEFWTGFVGDGLKKYERQFMTEVEYNTGTLLMAEVYDNVLHTYNRSENIGRISEKIIDFAQLQMKRKQKTL